MRPVGRISGERSFVLPASHVRVERGKAVTILWIVLVVVLVVVVLGFLGFR
jgi:hypothetical protein